MTTAAALLDLMLYLGADVEPVAVADLAFALGVGRGHMDGLLADATTLDARLWEGDRHQPGLPRVYVSLAPIAPAWID